MPHFWSQDTRRRTIAWIVGIVLTMVLTVGGLQFVGEGPPTRIVLATGQAGGVYDTFGREYQRRLGQLGLSVELLPTAGSIENFQRIIAGKADLAFSQSGTYDAATDPTHTVSGLAAIYFEPLWIFVRTSLKLDETTAFRAHSVAVGPKGSGTEAVARALIREQGYDPASPAIVNMSTAEARRQIEEGRVDVAFFITSYRDPGILELMRRTDVQLMSFRRDVAYARKLRGIVPIKIPEGLLDLRDNIPRENITLLSPLAMLVSRSDLNPRVVELVLKVAQTVHGGGSLIDPPLKFPTLEGVDVPVHEAAETYLMSGESFLSRTLPYRAFRWVTVVKILVLPLIAVWIPLFRILPMIVRWRSNRWLKRYYAKLRDMETSLATAQWPHELRAGISELEALRGEVQVLSRTMPLQQQQDVYHWRLHVSLILNEALERLRGMEASAPR